MQMRANNKDIIQVIFRVGSLRLIINILFLFFTLFLLSSNYVEAQTKKNFGKETEIKQNSKKTQQGSNHHTKNTEFAGGKIDVTNIGKEIQRVEKAIDDLQSKYDSIAKNITNIYPIIIPALTIAVAIIIGITGLMITFFYKRNSEISKGIEENKRRIENILMESEKNGKELHQLLSRYTEMQNHLFSLNSIKYNTLENAITEIHDESFRKNMGKIIELLYQFDSFQWGIVNSFSTQRKMRLKAIAKMATLQNEIDNAAKFLRICLDRFHEEEFQMERNVILRGLGLKI